MKILLGIAFISFGIVALFFGNKRINVKNRFFQYLLSQPWRVFAEEAGNRDTILLSAAFGLIFIAVGILVLIWPGA